jgi:hypothetical protein
MPPFTKNGQGRATHPNPETQSLHWSERVICGFCRPTSWKCKIENQANESCDRNPIHRTSRYPPSLLRDSTVYTTPLPDEAIHAPIHTPVYQARRTRHPDGIAVLVHGIVDGKKALCSAFSPSPTPSLPTDLTTQGTQRLHPDGQRMLSLQLSNATLIGEDQRRKQLWFVFRSIWTNQISDVRKRYP